MNGKCNILHLPTAAALCITFILTRLDIVPDLWEVSYIIYQSVVGYYREYSNICAKTTWFVLRVKNATLLPPHWLELH